MVKSSLSAVEVQVEIGQVLSARGFEERRERAFRGDGRQGGDLAIVAGLRNAGVARVVAREAEAAGVMFDEQQLVKAQQGVGEQSLAAQRLEFRPPDCSTSAWRSIFASVELGQQRLGGSLQAGESFQVRVALAVSAPRRSRSSRRSPGAGIGSCRRGARGSPHRDLSPWRAAQGWQPAPGRIGRHKPRQGAARPGRRAGL